MFVCWQIAALLFWFSCLIYIFTKRYLTWLINNWRTKFHESLFKIWEQLKIILALKYKPLRCHVWSIASTLLTLTMQGLVSSLLFNRMLYITVVTKGQKIRLTEDPVNSCAVLYYRFKIHLTTSWLGLKKIYPIFLSIVKNSTRTVSHS